MLNPSDELEPRNRQWARDSEVGDVDAVDVRMTRTSFFAARGGRTVLFHGHAESSCKRKRSTADVLVVRSTGPATADAAMGLDATTDRY